MSREINIDGLVIISPELFFKVKSITKKRQQSIVIEEEATIPKKEETTRE